jgi:hypothetical protein
VQWLALAPPIVPVKRLSYGASMTSTRRRRRRSILAYSVSFFQYGLGFGSHLAGSPATQITVDQARVYDFQHSIQIDKTTGGKGLFYLWYAKNGTDVASSGNAASDRGEQLRGGGRLELHIRPQSGRLH